MEILSHTQCYFFQTRHALRKLNGPRHAIFAGYPKHDHADISGVLDLCLHCARARRMWKRRAEGHAHKTSGRDSTSCLSSGTLGDQPAGLSTFQDTSKSQHNDNRGRAHKSRDTYNMMQFL
eukprot:5315042-Amphidinium_carterae.1